ncbi:MAG TPA: T9SS type A sorting domain-containing protein [Saprospiraceae bacterium]|nr:T9SS type A sorting domain-containing protein [Saprospiraceae bacterium]
MKITFFCIAFWGIFGTASAQLYLQNGAAIHQQAAANICLQDISLVQNGIWNTATGSALRLKESVGNADISIGGNNTAPFHNVNIQMQNREVKLLRDIQVNGTITFTSGHFNLNGYYIELGANAAVLGENENASFTGANGGSLIMQLNLNAPDEANPGNLGAEITTGEDLGLTTIERKHEVINSNGNQGIARQYIISPANNQGLNATLRFHYLDSELNGIPENELELWRNDGTGWENMGASNRNTAGNYVELTGINAFSAWTATNAANPLPIELTDFSGYMDGPKVRLEWRTASETQNAYFLVQHSTDAAVFHDLARIPGAGNSQVENNYQYTHKKPSPGANYYRLKQVDFDGRFEYSHIVSLKMHAVEGIQVYPNPFSGEFQIDINSEQDELPARIYDAAGRNVWQGMLHNTRQVLELPGIQSGMFWLEVDFDNRTERVRVLKN